MLGLTYIRQLFDMTMEELASKLSVSKQTISKWESKKVSISQERLNDLEETFKIPEEYFSKQLDEVDKLIIQKIKLETENEKKSIRKEVTDCEGDRYSFTEKVYDEEIQKKIKLIELEIDKAKMISDINNILNIKECDSIDEYMNKSWEIIGIYEYMAQIYKSGKLNYRTLSSIFDGIIIGYKIGDNIKIKEIAETRHLTKEIISIIRYINMNDEIERILQEMEIQMQMYNEEEYEKVMGKIRKVNKEMSFLLLKRQLNDSLFDAYRKNDVEFVRKVDKLLGIRNIIDIDLEDIMKIFDE